MAGDARDSSAPPPQPRGPPPGATEPPEHIRNGSPKIYEVFSGPPANANALPEGSGQNTAGARQETPKLTEAVKTVRWQDFKQVHMYPCVRESLLMGIAGGFGMGGVRAIWGAPIPKATNWAVGTFIVAALANYEFCQYKRMVERTYMKRAVEIVDRKKAEKEAEAKKRKEEGRKLKEEADKKAEEARKSWKFW